MTNRKTDSYKGYPDATHVVSTREAAGLLGSKDVVFVDTRNYWKYEKGHIPGAVNLELYGFHWVDTSPEGVKAFARMMAGLFGSFGISKEKDVIFYQNNSGYDAARGVWLLRLMGSVRGRLLDGGLNQWKRERRKLSTEDAKYDRAEFNLVLDESPLSTLGGLEGHVRKKDAVILDTRNPGEYSGRYRRGLKVGHVPGSLNIEWKKALRRDGSLKDAAQLSALYQGISRESEVVTYCQSGYRAAHTWLVLNLLGYKHARNYLGSWYEWANSDRTEVVR
jgi:thiosulfate/3-mercaptopyruvate sulfurtransferase